MIRLKGRGSLPQRPAPGATCWWKCGSSSPGTSTPQQHLLNELAKEEPEPHTQATGSSEHDEGLLKKLWNTITDSIADKKQEHRKD